eukprot:scaffold444_cov185-Prasinococcus_capsulatus_cf.AAC.2
MPRASSTSTGWPHGCRAVAVPPLQLALRRRLVLVPPALVLVILLLTAAAAASGEEEGVIEECGARGAAWGLGEAGAGAGAAAAAGLVLRRCSVAAMQERRGLLVLDHIPKTGGTTLYKRAADVLRGVRRCPNPTFGLNNETAVEGLACVVRAHHEQPEHEHEEEFVFHLARQPYFSRIPRGKGKKPPKDARILCGECD